MRFVYFTKTLQSLDVAGLIAFCKDVGLEGVDFAVRPGYPVTPENATAELPKAARTFKDAGLVIGLVTAPTGLNDPDSKHAQSLFEACGKSGVPAIKIGYFPYRGKFDPELAEARKKLAGFAKLAEKTGVKACYHTHSGNNLGGACAALRMLLADFDPHHIGAFVDTGHTAINGGPIRLELDMIRPWLSLLAIKDMAWQNTKQGWRSEVVPVGRGIVRWQEVGQGLKDVGFDGTVSVHGEYEAKDLAERTKLAKEELTALKMHFRSR